jgi:egghead protein (zeste-white 4 protein)
MTAFRFNVVIWLAGTLVSLYVIQGILFPYVGWRPTSVWGWIYAWSSIMWAIPLLSGGLGLIGMLAYKAPPESNKHQQPIPNLVSWRIVSRGTNMEALRSTIHRCRAEMAATPLFPYVIEVVTDTKCDLGEISSDLRHIVVPMKYQTSKGSLYKARALQYAVENSPLAAEAWIIHLDEETQPTVSGIQGIAEFIREEEASGELRIGQGALLYHRTWRKHFFMTMADMVRTGDDFGRFYVQHKIGLPVFGLHGSYILCRNDVESEVGFDFGPKGSITEDAFWALIQMQNGRRIRWCHGYLEEQSTQGPMDFMRQRKRWYLGLILVSFFAPVKWRYRFLLAFNTVLWTFTPFALLYTYVHLIFGSVVWGPLGFVANLGFSCYVLLYAMGLRANMDEHRIRRPLHRLGLYLTLVSLFPVFSVFEGGGVGMGVLRPSFGFHVVKK